MKALLFTLSFFVVSSGSASVVKMTWDKNLVTKLKNQTAFAAFCQKPKGVFAKEACAESAKDPGFKKFKFKVMEMVSATTIRVGDGPRSVEISFGAKSGQYTLNSRTVDFATMTPAEIADKISSALPKVATSLWLSKAYAGEEAFIYLSKAVHAMLASKSDDVICEHAQKVVEICGGDMPMTGAIGLLNAQTSYVGVRLDKSASISQLQDAAEKVREAAEHYGAFVNLSAGLIHTAYERSSESCEITIKEKKVNARTAILACEEQAKINQKEVDKTIAQMGIDSSGFTATQLQSLDRELADANFSQTKHLRTPMAPASSDPSPESGTQK